jgi:hypothetical protein
VVACGEDALVLEEIEAAADLAIGGASEPCALLPSILERRSASSTLSPSCSSGI